MTEIATFEMTITCPVCGGRHRVTVPKNQCVLAFDCPGCGAALRREAGSCCVFCSYKAPGAEARATV
ncbi:MAG: GDCCVxC domain-containing (seleno)protein [Pseudomonadota bacterium]